MKQLAKVAGLFQLCAGVFLLSLLTGCSGGPAQQDPSTTLVPITGVE
jgi:hypothetical protein